MGNILLASVHLIALQELATEEAAGHATYSLAEGDPLKPLFQGERSHGC